MSAELERIETELYSRSKPQLFSGADGLLIAMDKSFEMDCVLLQQKGIPNPKKATVLEFYQATELIKKQIDNGSKPKRIKKSKR